MRDSFPQGCLWVGHLKPDTDSVCSAFAAAELFRGDCAIAEQPNSESQFVINYFNLPSYTIFHPKNELEDERCIGIVDHNQQGQSPVNTSGDLEQLKAIVDHHAVQANIFDLGHILRMDVRPWGCTSTILFHIYKMSHLRPSKQAAGCMLSAILSDTLFLRSPTTTSFDQKYVEELANIAEIADVSGYYREMGKAKSDISLLTPKEVILADSKTFIIPWLTEGECSVFWGTFETYSPCDVLDSVELYLRAMREIKEEKGYDLVFFSVVDISRAQESAASDSLISSVLLPAEVEKEIAVAAYKKPLTTDNIMNSSPFSFVVFVVVCCFSSFFIF